MAMLKILMISKNKEQTLVEILLLMNTKNINASYLILDKV